MDDMARAVKALIADDDAEVEEIGALAYISCRLECMTDELGGTPIRDPERRGRIAAAVKMLRTAIKSIDDVIDGKPL